MIYDSRQHHRRSIRLPGYDYRSPGAYFVTLVTHRREMLFGEIVAGQMQTSPAGDIVRQEWLRCAEVRPEIDLEAFVVMPNHLHAVVLLRRMVGAHGRAPLQAESARRLRLPRSLGSLVAGFKAAATKRINQMRKTPGIPVWQRNYYDRVIRSEAELDRIRRYIAENPLRWADDAENPDRAGADHERAWDPS